jgi:phage gp16-like protein
MVAAAERVETDDRGAGGLSDRRRKMAIIHVAKKELGLDDESYRALLEGAAGVRSAADIETYRQYAAVLDAFKRLGFQKSRRPKVENPQLGKSYALWCRLYELGAVQSKRYGSMLSYVHRMAGDQDLYRRDQLSMVIESLKQWIDRLEHEQREGT